MVSIAGPPGSDTALTLCRRKASVLARSAGTTVAFVVATVGAEDAAAHAAEIEFKLLVNCTFDAALLRDQPSGTFTTNLPAGDRYATNTVLSGMSPGGLLSAGTGDWDPTGLAGGDDCASLGVGDGGELAAIEGGELLLAHPVSRSIATSAGSTGI
jgi:hypothetical protein